MTLSKNLSAMQRLIDIMDRLRSPGGCPWDAEQTPETLVPYLLEEAHETIEAIESGDPSLICDELGDLLLQVVFHARIFSERGAFDVGDIANAISDKLVRRHPHVFADVTLQSHGDLTAQWEKVKTGEKAQRGESERTLLESIPRSLPALSRTQKLMEKSARAGRIWPNSSENLASCATTVQALYTGMSDEALGEALFALVAVARDSGIDPEGALRRATQRHFQTGDDSA
ncbi:MAG: nucleoside triphosphate pyrophosphohydrolase [Desulfuromonadales bacterium]|nr:nucleoside triphosphate pyrophosphohydrolase [Desulfuromonadales bacterium]